MSAVTRPRGPLPARVYWTRRAVVIALAFVLVWGIGHLLGGGSDGRSSDIAELSGSTSQGPTSGSTSGSTGPTTSSSTARPTGKATDKSQPTRTQTPLAEPDGPCSATEVLVTPKVEGAVAGREVALTLQLTSTESEACSWRVSKDTLAVKLTSGSDFIWSSQNCPRSITMQDVVVRKAQPVTVTVTVTWSGRRSDDDCSRTTAWARPGYYHVLAAALGGTPTDQQFELDYPTRPTITVTVQPTNQPTDEPTKRSSSHPTGASEPSDPD